MTNKLGIVLGAAAIAAVAGCKDPNYVRRPSSVQNEVRPVPTEVAPVTPVVVSPDVTPVQGPEEPIMIVEQPEAVEVIEVVEIPQPVEVVPPPPVEVLPPPPPPAPVMTPYVVQRNDTLFLISKRYNIKLDAIRRANPNIKGDNIRAGQKIMLPGTVDVGEQRPVGPIVEPIQPPRPEYKPYTGPTKDYVVKGGDTLGKIAYSNGINIRQLKELNGLTGDIIRVGQKLKIPGVPPPKPAVAAQEKPKAPAVVKPAAAEVAPPVLLPAETAAPVVEEPVDAAPAAPAPETAAPAPAAEQSAETGVEGEDYVTYVVPEGEDITAISIAFGVDPAVIRELNNMGDQDQVKPNQAIKLPPDVQ